MKVFRLFYLVVITVSACFFVAKDGYCELEGCSNLGLYGCALERVVFDASSSTPADHTMYIRVNTPPGIYKRDVNGSSDWEYMGCDAATEIAVIQANGYLYYTSTNSMYYSTNGGTSWTEISEIIDGQPIRIVTIGSTEYIYVASTISGTGTKTVYYSSDYGVSWTQTFTGITATQFNDLAIANDGNTIYGVALVSGGYTLYRWRYSGGTWTQTTVDLTSVVAGFSPRSVIYDPNNNDIIYISGTDGSSGYLIKTVNGTATTPTYTQVDTTGVTITGYGIYIPHDSSCVYLAGSKLVADAWTNLPSPSAINGLNYVYGVHPTNSSIVVASCDKGIAISTDAGTSFSEFDQGLECVQIVGGFQNPADSTELFACAKSGIAKSSDSGANWSFFKHGPVWLGMAVDTTGAHMYACEAGGDVQRSMDGGTTWISMGLTDQVAADYPGGGSTYQVFADPVTAGIVYATLCTSGFADGAVYKQFDGTWTRVVNGFPFISISGYAVGSNSVLFAGYGDRSDGTEGTYEGMMISTDSGSTWTAIASLDGYIVRAIAVDPNNSNLIMVGTGDDWANQGARTDESCTIFVSSDGGTTWTNAEPNSMNEGAFTAIAFDPDTTATIDAYAAVCNDVYATTDDGASWYKYYEGASNERFQSLFMFSDVLAASSSARRGGLRAGDDVDIQAADYSLLYGSEAGLFLDGASSIWYFGEGCTASDFDVYFLLANPNSSEITVTGTYYKTDGNTVSETYSVPATSRYTVHADGISGLESTDLSAKFEAANSASFYMERAMYWSNMTKGHDTIGATATSNEWYLAEGCTSGTFDTYILLMNPNAVTANAALTFMKSDATTVVHSTTVGANSRKTIHADEIVENDSISTHIVSDQSIVAERAMYWDSMASGHCSIGTTSPSSTWYMTEGYTGGDFDTWVLIQNPNSTSVTCDVTFYINGEDAQTRQYTIEANSRDTIHVDNILSDHEVSTYVNAGTSQVICERAMYWGGTSGDGHCSIGTKTLSLSWYLAEGYTGGNFDEYILIMNPSATTATVTATYLRTGSDSISETYTVPAQSRYTIHADGISGLESAEFSTSISSDTPVAVERAMYFGGAGGHSSIGVK